MPFILLALVLGVGLLGSYIPYELKSFLYAISLAVKSLIIFALPLVIFGLLFKTASEMAQKASKVILLILAAICASNFITSVIGGCIGSIIYNFEFAINHPTESAKLITPFFDFTLPKLIANDKAMASALILGIIGGRTKPVIARQIAEKFGFIIQKILKALNYVIPFFVAGYLVKIEHEGLVLYIIENYALIFITIAIVAALYLSLFYFLVSGLSLASFARSIKNMLPACIVGFSTMSSAASMPLMISGTAKNSRHPELAKAVIPISTNFHLIGCSISIPIFTFAILKNYGMAEPSIISYLIFTAYFVIAKFSVAAVPGGGVLVMLPIIESCFGFNSDMLSLLTALYILFDPVITACNILGNGALAMGLSRKNL